MESLELLGKCAEDANYGGNAPTASNFAICISVAASEAHLINWILAGKNGHCFKQFVSIFNTETVYLAAVYFGRCSPPLQCDHVQSASHVAQVFLGYQNRRECVAFKFWRTETGLFETRRTFKSRSHI